MKRKLSFLLLACLCSFIPNAFCQEPGGGRPPEVVSAEVSADRKITFRLFAPKAEKVLVTSSDLPSAPQTGWAMTKDAKGVWEVSTEPVVGGAYRYYFVVDGVNVLDPKNKSFSESNGNVWNLVAVEGNGYSDRKNIPQGNVAQSHYFSTTLNQFRRAHIYTPPGYEKGTESYPVFYLLHGAFDSDASWSTVGQAGQILDNLIEAGKAKPMVVVMPMGHTAPFSFGPGNSFEKQMKDFATDFQKDLKPFVEARYRVKSDRQNRAIAGLSMGGAHTLDIAFTDLDQYAYVGVFSSGIFGIERGDSASGPGAAWMDAHKAAFENADLRKGLELVWFATGSQDFLIQTTKKTVSTLQEKGFQVEFKETEGGHTWLNWREYLHEFAPKLFVSKN